MAYDLTMNPEFMERWERERQFERNQALTSEQREARIEKLFGG